MDIALFDVAMAITGGVAAEYKVAGQVRHQLGNHSYWSITDCFEAKDGWVFISLLTNPIWRRFLKLVDKEQLAEDPRFVDDYTRFVNRESFEHIVVQWVRERTVDEVVSTLEKAGIPCGVVNTIPQAISDPQVKAREMLVDVEYPGLGPVPIPGVVAKFSETPGRIETRAPLVGEHNQQIYGGLLGLASEDLESLARDDVI